MKMDLVIGNPPYQELDGGGAVTESAMPLYQSFVYVAIKMKPKYISMVIPSRWMAGGKPALDDFRTHMVECQHLKSIHNFLNAKDLFNGVQIAGGVQYFLYESNNIFDKVEVSNCNLSTDGIIANSVVRDLKAYKYDVVGSMGKKQYMIVADNRAVGVVAKVINSELGMMDSVVSQRRPFGLSSDFEDNSVYSESTPIKVLCSGGRVTYTDYIHITQNDGIIDKWKTAVAKVSSTDGMLDKNGFRAIISKPFTLKPGEVCSETYLILGSFDTEAEAESCISYISTRFARYLIYVTLTGMNTTSRNYMFVPIVSTDRIWTDEQLYEKYNITPDEIEIIESTIKA